MYKTTSKIIALICISHLAIAASSSTGRRERTRSEEMLDIALAESERTTAEEAKARAEYERNLKAAVDASRSTGAARAESPDSRALREALHASRLSASTEEKVRAQRAEFAARKDVAIAAHAESKHVLASWSNPTYIRAHLEELIRDDDAYRSIVSTNLSIDERIAREGEFAKGGGALETGYRRKKLEKVIAKLEAGG